tara:strand:+ start:278 stop:598 length:321 start_codon:yes stop_codon:yes gene_type:complete
MALGNEIDNAIKMQEDMIGDSFKFIIKNIDQILMVIIIFFLTITWTIIFEWEFPKEKKVIFKKNISLANVKTRENMLHSINEDHVKSITCGGNKLCKTGLLSNIYH